MLTESEIWSVDRALYFYEDMGILTFELKTTGTEHITWLLIIEGESVRFTSENANIIYLLHGIGIGRKNGIKFTI